MCVIVSTSVCSTYSVGSLSSSVSIFPIVLTTVSSSICTFINEWVSYLFNRGHLSFKLFVES